MAHRLSPHQVRVLAVTAGVDPRTAQRWLDGASVTSTVAARLEETCKRLYTQGLLPQVTP
jgi:hypothetical protein